MLCFYSPHMLLLYATVKTRYTFFANDKLCHTQILIKLKQTFNIIKNINYSRRLSFTFFCGKMKPSNMKLSLLFYVRLLVLCVDQYARIVSYIAASIFVFVLLTISFQVRESSQQTCNNKTWLVHHSRGFSTIKCTMWKCRDKSTY